MDREHRRHLEDYRRETAGPFENTLIDELVDGEMSRAEFVRRASVVGLSLGVVGSALGAVGEARAATFAPQAAARVGGRLRVQIGSPTAPIEPHMLSAVGELATASINGEFLTRATQNLTLAPELAVSWKPNRNGSVWTFKLRQGVKFQNGATLKAEDVIATFNRLVDPSSGSQALSAFKGVLSPGGIKKIDDLTVQFVLDGPTASFPYLTSSQTYQAIILPADYKLGTYTSTPQATGAFILSSYSPGVSVKYDRNPSWWRGKALLDGVDVTYYTENVSAANALLGGQTDLVASIAYLAGGRGLIQNSRVQIFKASGSAHREISMRTDKAPFNDARVRRALALTLNRPDMIKRVVGGLADVGNDSPFAPVYPSTVKSVPQRHQDLQQARQLLDAAGHKKVKVEITTWGPGELAAISQVLQASAKKVGFDISIKVETAGAYFGGKYGGGADGYGTTPWLNTPFNVTDWGHRAVPNVFLTASLMSHGVWNASRYSSKRFDSLAKSYLGAISLKDQRKYAVQMETLLLKDSPVVYPYFYEYLAAGTKKVQGYKADAESLVTLGRTSLA